MTPDEQAFLRAIAEDLSDDTSRLAYADWLEGTKPNSTQADHDRALFIRIQISFATDSDLASNDGKTRGKSLQRAGESSEIGSARGSKSRHR